jgi:hypothetical protein
MESVPISHEQDHPFRAEVAHDPLGHWRYVFLRRHTHSPETLERIPSHFRFSEVHTLFFTPSAYPG